MSESVLRLIVDAHLALKSDAAIRQRQRSRLADAVARARNSSPFYRDLYAGLPGQIDDPTLLPATDKATLMARFDEWVTDAEITSDAVRDLVADPARIGESFLGRYTVATTSGTTGTPGIFVIDDRSLAVTNAMAVRMLRNWLSMRDVARIIRKRGRMSMVMATGGHFASAVAASKLLRGRNASRLQVLSVHEPLPRLVDELNRFDPAAVAPYASVAAMLADERAAGRLHIEPALLALAAEGLLADEYERIARTFGAKVGNSYAATECTYLSYSCDEGWLHVNADWVLLEPVDVDGQPTPPGEPSHTVYISNLANRVQPILRYDLGDSVLQRPDPCPCGLRLPAIRVQGRAGDVLSLPADDGRTVTIPPLSFGVAIEAAGGTERHQVEQTALDRLAVRLQPVPGGDPEAVWRTVEGRLLSLLADHGITGVSVERASGPPKASASGKFRSVIPLKASSARRDQ